MAYTGLKDGGLSVKIDGVEHVGDIHGLRFETTIHGDGAASFWIQPYDPFERIAPEFHPMAPVEITHTYDGATTALYKGFIVSDPTVGYAGESRRVDIECGGALDVMRHRGDLAFVFTDSDPDWWFENKRNGKWASIDISNRVEIRVDDGTKVPRGPNDTPRAAVVGYLAYEGARHMFKGHTPPGPMNGVKRITGKVYCNLKDGMQAKLGWRNGYSVSRDPSDYTTIKSWPTGTVVRGQALDETFGGTSGAGYVALLLWTTRKNGSVVTDDRFIRISNPEMHHDTYEYRVDDALLAIANVAGMHNTSSTAAIGRVVQSLAVRSMTDYVSAMNTVAQQADVLVHWGYYSYYSSGCKYRFVAKPLMTNPEEIRDLSNCYKIDLFETPGIEWDVRQHPEDGGNWRALRMSYSRRGEDSIYPPGFPDQVCSPVSNPGWGTSIPGLGATARVLAVDFTGHNYSPEQARRLARRLARSLGMGLSSGTCMIRVQTVKRYGDNADVPAPYIRGGDFVECVQSSCGPLPVVSSMVDVDTEAVRLEVGVEMESLIEQLEAAGGITKVALAKGGRARPVRHSPRKKVG